MVYVLRICYIFFLVLLVIRFLLGGLGFWIFYNNLVIFLEWEIVSLNSINFVITILLDWISLFFMRVVLIISSMVILYSKRYMSSEMNINRFIILILLFVLSIIFMIIRPNLLRILLGWDGLGLVSYCLVIYYQNVKSYNSGIITVLINRVGDVIILIGIVWMLNFGRWNYIYLFDFYINDLRIRIVGGFVVLAAITKRAQIPFSSWLPAAIAAPTPISALVHSSTLVTAGVYLLIRFRSLLDSTIIFKVLLLISGLTILISGIAATLEFDLKKIIALSTLSQLGLIIIILRLGLENLAYFHLLRHAFFKALLFICAGRVIHFIGDNQDIRYMGNIVKIRPLVSLCLNVSNLALCGFPFIAGFYSKDLILEMFIIINFNLLVFILFFLSTGFTVSYTVRLLYYSLFYDFNIFTIFSLEESYLISGSMIILIVLRVTGGRFLRWLILFTPMIIYLTFHIKIIVIYVIFIGFLFILGLINVLFKFRYYLLKFYKLRVFNNYIWFLSSLSLFGLNYGFLNLGFKSLKILDFGWSEYLLGQGIFYNLKNFRIINQFIQFNFLKIFLIVFVVYVLSIVFLIVYYLYLDSLF